MKEKEVVISEREFVQFSQITNYSDKQTFNKCRGLNLRFRDDNQRLYIQPVNGRGHEHPLRWTSIHKEDIPLLIDSLKSFL